METKIKETKQLEILLQEAYEKGYEGATLQELLEQMKSGLKRITQMK
ncbi:hypothetical protein ACFSTA_08845 [Ornithinibacillus salinisoli]|uniref:Aspartyl-phosphate phosphatase Spo0E family protein n=1 Tax=Ornithinibacillus salinisoli TaxID=1848459 RepID=A0ABW4W142_9BACI